MGIANVKALHAIGVTERQAATPEQMRLAKERADLVITGDAVYDPDSLMLAYFADGQAHRIDPTRLSVFIEGTMTVGKVARLP